MARNFSLEKGTFSQGILCVFQENTTYFQRKTAARCEAAFNQRLQKAAQVLCGSVSN